MPTKTQREALRRLPAVHLLLEHPALGPYLERFPRKLVVDIANEVLTDERRRMLDTDHPTPPDPERIAARIAESLDALTHPPPPSRRQRERHRPPHPTWDGPG